MGAMMWMKALQEAAEAGPSSGQEEGAGAGGASWAARQTDCRGRSGRLEEDWTQGCPGLEPRMKETESELVTGWESSWATS